jgi:hypothetical protein
MRVDAFTAGLGGVALLSVQVLLSLQVLMLVEASAAPKVGETVAVTACARAGVEASCLMITGGDGTVFNITSANPRPLLDVMIQLRGTVTDKLSACNQGTVLDNISWTPTQQKCGN